MYTHALTRATIYMVASLALASPRLASHRSPRLTRLATHALASLSLAYSPRIARIASLGITSPRIASQHRLASPRLALHRIASLAVTSPRPPPVGSFASPRLARLASMIASPLSPCLASLALPRLVRLASPRSPCLASRSLASPRLRARLPRSPCLLPRLGQPLATSASRCLQRCLQNLASRRRNSENRRTRFSGGMATPSLNWGSTLTVTSADRHCRVHARNFKIWPRPKTLLERI